MNRNYPFHLEPQTEAQDTRRASAAALVSLAKAREALANRRRIARCDRILTACALAALALTAAAVWVIL